MSKRLRHFIQNQSRVKVAQIEQSDLGNVWYGALAVVVAGVFYFWAYYFWGDGWRVLTGG